MTTHEQECSEGFQVGITTAKDTRGVVRTQDPGPERTDRNIGESRKEQVNGLVPLNEVWHHRSVLGFVES
jgi:hypothetical protein